MSTCNHRLDLQTLGSQLVIMPKNLPNHLASSHPSTDSDDQPRDDKKGRRSINKQLTMDVPAASSRKGISRFLGAELASDCHLVCCKWCARNDCEVAESSTGRRIDFAQESDFRKHIEIFIYIQSIDTPTWSKMSAGWLPKICRIEIQQCFGWWASERAIVFIKTWDRSIKRHIALTWAEESPTCTNTSSSSSLLLSPISILIIYNLPAGHTTSIFAYIQYTIWYYKH